MSWRRFASEGHGAVSGGPTSQDDLPLVGLITIWYRAAEEMDHFLSDLKTLQYTRLRSVFVIHGQTSGEVERLRSTVPQAVILQPGRNLGCAAGWNLGISGLLDDGVDYIGMWNADVGVDPRYLERLVAIMQNDSTIGACQPLLFYSDEPTKVQMYGGSVNPSTGAGRHDYNGSTALTALPPWRDAQYLDGGTMLIRASVLRQVGGFDERFFMYAEDSDLSRRIQKAGYRTVAVRDAWTWHYHRQIRGDFPAPSQLFYETRNRFYFVRKHAGARARWALVGRTLSRTLPRQLFYYLRRRRVTLAGACVAGTVYGMAELMGKRGWVE